MSSRVVPALLVGLLMPGVVLAAMSSTSYTIRNDSFVQAGGEVTSASYGLFATAGEVGAGNSASLSYKVNAGLAPGYFAEVMKFTVYGLDTSTEVGAVSRAGSVVTVTDGTDYIETDQHSVFGAIFENKGTDDEEVFFGFLATADASTLTLGQETNSSNGTFIGSSGSGPQVNGVMNIDGVNDYVYRFVTPPPARAFGEISSALVASTAYMFSVESDDDIGYKVYVSVPDDSDTLLDYPGVEDGHVNAGEAEWGGRASDLTLDTDFDVEDSAITAETEMIAHRGPGSLNDRDYFVLRLATNNAFDGESYAGDVQFTVVGDY